MAAGALPLPAVPDVVDSSPHERGPAARRWTITTRGRAADARGALAGAARHHAPP